MARIVQPGEWGNRATRGRVTEWRRWCDGVARELTVGEDIPDDGVSAYSKRSSFRQWAARQPGVTAEFMNKHVHTWVPDHRTLGILVDGGMPRAAEPGSPMAERQEVPSDQASGAKQVQAAAVRRRSRVARS